MEQAGSFFMLKTSQIIIRVSILTVDNLVRAFYVRSVQFINYMYIVCRCKCEKGHSMIYRSHNQQYSPTIELYNFM